MAQGHGAVPTGSLPDPVVMPSAIAVELSGDKAVKSTSAGNSGLEEGNPHESPGSYTAGSNTSQSFELRANNTQGQAPPDAAPSNDKFSNKKGMFHPDNVLGCMCPGKLKELPPCRMCLFCCLGCYLTVNGLGSGGC
jgi:hypothetical protein